MATRVNANTARRNTVNHNRKSEYVYGNTARALAPIGVEIKPQPKLSKREAKRQEKSAHMNPAYGLFMMAAMVCTVFVCIQYLRLQSEVTSKVAEISKLEAQLNELKAENDDTESRIKGAVDLEQVKYRAMNELGMQYANSDQIVAYVCDDTDYVTQLIDIE